MLCVVHSQFHGGTPVKEGVIVGCATEYKNDLISNGKIDPSWKGVKLDKAETLEGKKMKEWKRSFKNPAEKDATKQTNSLHVLCPEWQLHRCQFHRKVNP
jgi:hypothetical protein